MHFTNRNYYYRRKPGKKRKASKLKVWLYRFIKIAFVIWFLYLFLGGQYGLIKIITLYTNIKRTERRIDKVNAEYLILSKDCNKLKNNLFEVERIAREKLGMIKDGEIVYKIIKKK
jgi:cell division protein FtsB